MPETKQQALDRAKRLGYPIITVVQADNGQWFVDPLGVTSAAGKRAYANQRAAGETDKGKAAAIAHMVDDREKAKRKK